MIPYSVLKVHDPSQRYFCPGPKIWYSNLPHSGLFLPLVACGASKERKYHSLINPINPVMCLNSDTPTALDFPIAPLHSLRPLYWNSPIHPITSIHN